MCGGDYLRKRRAGALRDFAAVFVLGSKGAVTGDFDSHKPEAGFNGYDMALLDAALESDSIARITEANPAELFSLDG